MKKKPKYNMFDMVFHPEKFKGEKMMVAEGVVIPDAVNTVLDAINNIASKVGVGTSIDSAIKQEVDKMREKLSVKETMYHRCNFIYKKGTDSFCDNHGTRYWKAIDINVKKSFYKNYIIHYDNNVTGAKKYMVYFEPTEYGSLWEYETDSFKDAVKWLSHKLSPYRPIRYCPTCCVTNPKGLWKCGACNGPTIEKHER